MLIFLSRWENEETEAMPLKATLVKPFCQSESRPFSSPCHLHWCFHVLSLEVILSNRCFCRLQREWVQANNGLLVVAWLTSCPYLLFLGGVTFSASERCSARLCLENSFHSSEVLFEEDPLGYLRRFMFCGPSWDTVAIPDLANPYFKILLFCFFFFFF